MAIELTGFQLHIELLGEKKARRSKTFEVAADSGAVDDDAAYAAARGNAVSFITQFALITGAEILAWSLRGIHQETAAVAVPADADLYTEAVLSVGLDAAGFKTGTITVPAPADGIFVGDDETTQQVDTTDTQLLTWLANFEDPLFFRLSDGEQSLSDPRIVRSRIRSVGSGKTF